MAVLETLAWLVLLPAALPASAGSLGNEKGLAWASRRDLTSQQFSEAFDDYRQVDLARFGWKVLNGEVVSANTRDTGAGLPSTRTAAMRWAGT